jgi:hypothetical protein
MKSDKSSVLSDSVTVIDVDWISSRFMTPSDKLDKLDATNRFFTTTELKFTDTTIGGNLGINSRPQFTRYCDIKGNNKVPRKPVTVPGRTGDHGMGRYYSEAIDDNAQLVFMEFGVPKFNSLLDFFTRAIDYEESYIANTGRVPVGYTVGKIVGDGVMLAAFPLITLAIWGIKIAYKLATGVGNFDYYYLEPAMHMYWGAVNHIVTNLATEMGILIPELMEKGVEANKIGLPVRLNQADIAEFKERIPGIFSNNNYIDVFAIATRSQSIANRQMLRDKDLYESGDISKFDFKGYVKTSTSVSEFQSDGSGLFNSINSALTFSKYLENVAKDGKLFGDQIKPVEIPETASTPATTSPESGTDSASTSASNTSYAETKFSKDETGKYPSSSNADESYLNKYVDALDSSVRGGGAYAAFYVDYTGSVSESFSNSAGNIDTGDKLKGLTSEARNVKFDLAGGNLAPGMGEVVANAKSFLAGALDSVTLGLSSVLQTITGNGYVDIPKKWDDSDMSMPSISYNMQLVSPYGNPISQLQNIYIPLAMLLAGTLPLSTGKSSYTSPFLCSLFSKGVQRIKLGMITNLSITRGTTNLGFSQTRRPLAIDVSFTVTDFSTKMTAPVSTSLFNIFNVSVEDDTPLANYIATLGSRDLLTSKYTIPQIKIRASRLLMNKDQMISPALWGLRTGEKLNYVLGGLVADHSLSILNKN